MMVVRLTKAIAVLSIGLSTALAALNNLTDYESNLRFVQHVLSMDTTFPDNRLMWRAVELPAAQHAAYLFIIAVEFLSAGLCIWGGSKLCRNLRDAAAFERAKTPATWGLLAGFLLWFVGFLVIGGEWYVMWQSDTWNGQQAAFRNTAITLLVLIYLSTSDQRVSD